jgi:hypothetical protein
MGQRSIFGNIRDNCSLPQFPGAVSAADWIKEDAVENVK